MVAAAGPDLPEKGKDGGRAKIQLLDLDLGPGQQ